MSRSSKAGTIAILKRGRKDNSRNGQLAAYVCQLALLLVGFALLGTPGISSSRQEGGPQAYRQRPVSLLLVDRHDDQRFAHPLDKRLQKNWRGTHSDPFLPSETAELHPGAVYTLAAERRIFLPPQDAPSGFLARAPPHGQA